MLENTGQIMFNSNNQKLEEDTMIIKNQLKVHQLNQF